MSWLDDMLSTNANPDPNQVPNFGLLGALGGLGMAATPHPGKGMGFGNALFATTGDLAQGYGAGKQAQQQYQAGNIGNQMQGLALQRQQALQPYQLNMMKQAMSGQQAPGALGGSQMSAADQQFGQAYQLALASGDMAKASGVLQSWAEHNPQLAGAIKLQQETATPQKMADGTYKFLSSNGYSSPTPTLGSLSGPSVDDVVSQAIKTTQNNQDLQPMGPGNQAPQERLPNDMPQAMGTQPPIQPVQQGRLPAPPMPSAFNGIPGMQGLPSNGQPMPQVPPMVGQPQPPQAMPRQAAFMPASGQSQATQQNPLTSIIAQQQAKNSSSLASDGKPYVPSMQNASLFPPDPTGNALYKMNANDDMSKEQVNSRMKGDIEDDKAMGEKLANTNQMVSRINDMAAALKSGQAGNLISQDPDLANKLIAAGIITDKGQINDVAQFQRFGASRVIEVLNQIKSTVPGSKVMNSEFQQLSKEAADPSQQPAAIQNALSMAQGMAEYNKDMVNGWTNNGGLGNRRAGGFTESPSVYERNFNNTHNLDDYINQSRQQIGPLRGMDNDPLTIARAAIAKGAPRQAVIERLRQNNIDPGGL